MNECKYYNIECPFALLSEMSLPCFATQKQCDTFREKNKRRKLSKNNGSR